jgi:hypothetical protein
MSVGGAEAGAPEAGVGDGAGLGTGAAPELLDASSFNGCVPHGRRTLPAWTVTGSEADKPPALIVTIVVPEL